MYLNIQLYIDPGGIPLRNTADHADADRATTRRLLVI